MYVLSPWHKHPHRFRHFVGLLSVFNCAGRKVSLFSLRGAPITRVVSLRTVEIGGTVIPFCKHAWMQIDLSHCFKFLVLRTNKMLQFRGKTNWGKVLLYVLAFKIRCRSWLVVIVKASIAQAVAGVGLLFRRNSTD
jgi:hypothetical protein